MLFAAASIGILATLGVIVSLGTETVAFFREVSIFDYLGGTRFPLTMLHDFLRD